MPKGIFKRNRSEIKDRFWKYVVKSSKCWEWIGAKYPNGYGCIRKSAPDRMMVSAHRLSYELHNGKIPEGLFVLHSCDNPPCVNPKHLFVGTNADNMKDMRSKNRGAVRENHPMAKLNPKKVERIRKLYKTGSLSQDSIGEKFGVSRSSIFKIVNNLQWKA